MGAVDNEDDGFGIPDDDADEQMDDVAPGVEYQSAITGVDDQNIVQFVLMQLLSHIRAPRYTYGKFKKWCMLAQSRQFKFAGMQSQSQAFNQLEHLFAMEELRPVLREATVRVLKSGCVTADILDQVSEEIAEGHPPIQEVSRGGDESSVDESLEDDSSLSSIEDTNERPFIDEGHELITTRTIKVVCTPLRAALIHLLRNRPSLFKPENLVVNAQPGETYNKYVPANGRVGESLTGSWYSDAWDRKVGADKSKFLCPLILFMDETITEFMGRYGLEPLVFTLAIFKERIRRKAFAWQTMGMVPSTRRYKSSKQSNRERQLIKGIHCDNLHRVLDVMLNELVQIQREGGLEMDICFTGDNVYVRRWVIFSIMFIMGDCKGNDGLAGRFSSHTKGVRKISRACNCKSKNADNTSFKCKFLTKAEVKDAVHRNDLDELKELSQHNVRNAFHSVCFGGDPYNVHGCTPLDVTVHVSQLGIYKYIIKVFFKLLKPLAGTEFDNYVKLFYSLPKQRASQNLPRTDYGHGISNITGLTAAEYSGCIFVMALIMMTDDGKALCERAFGVEVDDDGRTQGDNYLYLFEMLLCFELWAKKAEYWEVGDKEAEKTAHAAIIVLLDAVKHIADRTDGYQWKLPKFHELLHLVWYMTRFGGARNFDAGMGEKNHQVLAKWPAATSQKRYATFDKQSMDRLHELFVLNRALEEFTDNGLLPDEYQGVLTADEEATDTQQEDQDESVVGSAKFEVGKRDGTLCLYWKKRGKHICLPNVMPELLDNVVSRYFVKENGVHVAKYKNFHIHSDYTSKEGTVYRAHPYFRSKQWNDWVTIQWRTHPRKRDLTPPIPAQVMLLMSYEKHGVVQHEAIIWSATGYRSPAEYSVMGSKFKLEETRNGEPKFQSIKADEMGPHCFCFPNFGSESREHFIIADKSSWADKFCTV
jgi:hypothetical protein